MLYLEERLNYIDVDMKYSLISKTDEVSKIIRGLIKAIKPN